MFATSAGRLAKVFQGQSLIFKSRFPIINQTKIVRGSPVALFRGQLIPHDGFGQVSPGIPVLAGAPDKMGRNPRRQGRRVDPALVGGNKPDQPGQALGVFQRIKQAFLIV